MKYLFYILFLTNTVLGQQINTDLNQSNDGLIQFLKLNEGFTDKESIDLQLEMIDLEEHIKSIVNANQKRPTIVSSKIKKKQDLTLPESLKQLIVKQIQPEIEHLMNFTITQSENEIIRLGSLYFLNEMFNAQIDTTAYEVAYFYRSQIQSIESPEKQDLIREIENKIVNSLSQKFSEFTVSVNIMTKRNFSEITQFQLLTTLFNSISDQQDQKVVQQYLIGQLEFILHDKPLSLLHSQLIDQIMINLSLHKISNELFIRVMELIINYQIYEWQHKPSIPYSSQKGQKLTNHNIAEINPFIIRFFAELMEKRVLFKNQITDISFLHQLSRRFVGNNIELKFINSWAEYWAKNSFEISISDRMYLKSMNLDYLMIPRIKCEGVF